MSSRREQLSEQLRGAVRRACVRFIDEVQARVPKGAHGRVVLDEKNALTYRRVEREYGLWIEKRPSTLDALKRAEYTALDKAPDYLLVLGAMKIQELYEDVFENIDADERDMEAATDAALAFVESFDSK